MNCRVLITGCLIFLAATTSRVVADDALPLRSQSQRRPQILVTATGNLITGELVPRPGGYDVHQPSGRTFVPSQQIRFVAVSRDDAYQKMRDSVTDLTPARHLELARWCLRHHMQGSARREVLDALHLDPYNKTARRMLEDLVREEQRNTAEQRPTSRIDPKKVAVQMFDRRSLGGLPVELATTFTRHVQPLLSAKCGNARCHGSGQNNFRVQPLRGVSMTHVSEVNLASVVNQVDTENPLQSALLQPTQGLHGGSRTLVFSGRSGRLQSKMLRDWVMAVAEELRPSTALRRKTAANPRRDKRPQQNSSQNVPPVTANSRSVQTQGTVTKETDQTFLAKAKAATRRDAFDPDEFNSRFFGSPQQNAASRSESGAETTSGTPQINE